MSDDDIRQARPRFALDDVPMRMRKLPLDHRGFPVPWFVAWFRDGKTVNPGYGEPDFRVVDTPKLGRAVKERLCWVCGERLGRHLAFVIGPMCAVNRINSEPPSHRECALFSMRGCPFLSRPRMRRNEKDMPAGTVDAAGQPIDRNPGVMALWTTTGYKPFSAELGNPGVLFQLGDPERVEWFAEGRAATRVEVDAALSSGLPTLRAIAETEGQDAVDQLVALIDRMQPLLPRP